MRRQGWEDALGWLSDNCDFRPGLYSISCFFGLDVYVGKAVLVSKDS